VGAKNTGAAGTTTTPAGGTAAAGTGAAAGTTAPGSTTPAAGSAAGAGTDAAAGAGGGTGTGGQVSLLNPDGKTSCDQDTGQCTQLAASPAEIPADSVTGLSRWAVWLMVALLLGLILAPPALVLSSRKGRG
jgi:hypothetical protein